jgi:hypothetical protein
VLLLERRNIYKPRKRKIQKAFHLDKWQWFSVLLLMHGDLMNKGFLPRPKGGHNVLKSLHNFSASKYVMLLKRQPLRKKRITELLPGCSTCSNTNGLVPSESTNNSIFWSQNYNWKK